MSDSLKVLLQSAASDRNSDPSVYWVTFTHKSDLETRAIFGSMPLSVAALVLGFNSIILGGIGR